ncbi:MAG: AI-2E family transporter [Cyclobacteriaceae bacterium]
MSSIDQQVPVLKKIILYLLFGLLFFGSLYLASSFLIPLAVAVLIALTLVPMCRWLEGKGLNRGSSSFLGIMVVLAFFIGVFLIVTYQISSLAENWDQTKEQITSTTEEVKSYMDRNGISTEWVSQKIEDISKSSGSDVQKLLSTTFGSLGKFLLMLIYAYLLLFYRGKFKKFIQKLTPPEDTQETSKILEQISSIAQSYLFGKFLLIVILSCLYGAGFMIIGIKYAFIVAIIAGVLSLIPYFGNMIGGGLAVLFALISNGSLNGVIGVFVVMTIAQLLENYVLTPLIVGKKVDLNPFFTIMIVVLGGAVWDIPGMIVAVPYLGIIKILLDHTVSFKPYAYLIGDDSEDGDEEDSILSRAEHWVKEKVT